MILGVISEGSSVIGDHRTSPPIHRQSASDHRAITADHLPITNHSFEKAEESAASAAFWKMGRLRGPFPVFLAALPTLRGHRRREKKRWGGRPAVQKR